MVVSDVNVLYIRDADVVASAAPCSAPYSIYEYKSFIHLDQDRNGHDADVTTLTIQHNMISVDWQKQNHVLLLF